MAFSDTVISCSLVLLVLVAAWLFNFAREMADRQRRGK